MERGNIQRSATAAKFPSLGTIETGLLYAALLMKYFITENNTQRVRV